MEITRAKLASLMISVVYLISSYLAGGAEGAKYCLLLVIPLTLIWFPDELGAYKGWAGKYPRIDQETPGCVVAGLGWLALLGGPPLLYYLYLRTLPGGG